jgi:hypothetical protein
MMGCYMALLLLGLIIQFNFSYRDVKPLASTTIVRTGLLQGIRTEPSKRQLLENLVSIYNQYNCKDKTFLTFVDQPLLYYLFQRPAVGGLSWLSPEILYIIPTEIAIRSALSNKIGWCIFTTRGNTTEEAFTQFLPTVSAYIKQHSQREIVLKTVKPTTAQSYPMEYSIYIR